MPDGPTSRPHVDPAPRHCGWGFGMNAGRAPYTGSETVFLAQTRTVRWAAHSGASGSHAVAWRTHGQRDRVRACNVKQGSVVGIWSFAIWSLVRVFGAATDCRHLSFAGPRPSGKVRSFAPQTDMFATTRQICRSPLVLSVGRAERRKHPSAIGFLLSEDHGLFSRQSQCTHLRIPRPPLLGGAVPRCPRSPVQTSAPVPVPVPVFCAKLC